MQRVSLRTSDEMPPYSLVAQFYDHLMRHVNYGRWASYIMDLFRLAEGGSERQPGRQVNAILELACGTGRILEVMARAGFTVYGLDLSPEMLRLAAARVREVRGRARVWCAEMQRPAARLQVDAVLCLYDSMNYCRQPEDFTRVFAALVEVVRPGGLFIFDVCTRLNCWRNFRDYFEEDEFGTFRYCRRSYFKPVGNLQVNEFLIHDQRYPGITLREQHVQRIYSLNDIRRFAAQTPWEEAGCFNGMSHRPGSERADRVHFVFRRRVT